MGGVSGELKDELTKRLSSVLDGSWTLRRIERLTGGASRETWAITAVSATGDTRELILRRDPPGREDARRIAMEAASFDEAARIGVPVPDVIDRSGDEPHPGIGAYLVMSKVPGEALPQKLLRDENLAEVRAALPYELGRILARIHRMDIEAVPNLPEHDPLTSLFDEYLTNGNPVPTLEAAFAWLLRNRPPATGKAFVHGDFRNGNLLVDAEGVRGVLDWELAHVGDPMEDLGWLCTRTWRFGSPHPVGGFGSRDDLFRGYADESGESPDPEVLHWWEVYGSLRWAVICRMQAAAAATGGDNTLELLAIGRRVAECEHDLLDLLDVPPHDETETPPATPQFLGAPPVEELLGAVREFVLEVGAGADAKTRYRSRVAAHVLGIAAREALFAPAVRETYRVRLAGLGYRSEAELALGVRAGRDHLDDLQVAEVIRGLAANRLKVANPKYR
ncbi:phosphotransferase family protein [Rhodococcus pyridinivorans]|uniref:Phosphotransferase family protein n=1 Tax=Rhodococcus pyridinivorans TaxID=103816 RepID=A0A7M2XMI7_9NOCA|nr:phosphotransferase family protein [Rhodococcus pyridinivorans]QOV98623.1 phosphotransferase family protein [Rhodococcus pyridinivorans]WMM72517.1 phosphotransferase family protein [Rhodococcus pyridinivorans]